jgi:AGCS family alanine or glycine:cation symporter
MSATADPRGISARAFEQAFPGGGYVVELGLVLFAFATIVAWYYYGEKCVEYLTRGKGKGIYRLVYVAMIYWGCVAVPEAVWGFADLFNGLMALPNLLALLALWPAVKRLSDDFFGDPHSIRR